MKIQFIQDIIDVLRRKKINWRDKSNWNNETKYKENICQAYYNFLGKELDLNNPKTFSEKMQWLRVYDNTPLKTQLADKYLVRDWIKEKIGEEYLIPLYGVYDNFNEIDFSKLPNQFVIQCNHGCGYNVIVKDKSQLDINDVKKKINKWMKENFAYQCGEWHYKDIKRKIIITKYLEELSGDISDYKYFCFNGKPAYIMLCIDRKSGVVKNCFFNLGWENKQFSYFGELITQNINKPKNLELMSSLAEKLCQDFKHVRVDFYNINGKIYFGEMTFTSFCGYFKFNPPEWDEKLGNMLNLEYTNEPTSSVNV